jgi:carbon monoxide dehydrogenase subunit G
MKKIIFSTALLLLSIFSTGQITSETRQTGNFTGIDVSSAIEVEYVQAPNISVKVEAETSVMQKIITEVKEGVLHLYTEDIRNLKSDIKIFVSCPNLNSLDVSGAAEFKSAATIKITNLKLEVSGAGYVKIPVDGNEIMADISGAADAALKGNISKLKAEVSGASNLRAAALKCDKVTIEVSGAADATVSAASELKADVSGASSLRYVGTPSIKDLESSGASSIKKYEKGEDK